jgi:hypothetical protein
MPIYTGDDWDIPIGPGCEFETIEEAMMIREKDNVPRSEDCDFSGGLVYTEEEKKEMEDFAVMVMGKIEEKKLINPLHSKNEIKKKDYKKTIDLFDIDPRIFKDMLFIDVLKLKIEAATKKLNKELDKPFMERDNWFISELTKAINWNKNALKECS